jgi:lipopolysaccharide export system permease protein
MALVLVMLAVPLSRQSPREPRFGRILLAVLGFYVYYLLLALCRGQIVKGHWHHAGSLWAVSALVFALAVWLFRRQYAARKPRKAGA